MYPLLRTLSVGFLLIAPLRADTYTSPFEINVDPQITTWTSDFASRTSDVVTYSTPTPSAWYTHDYNTSLPYGPTLPQLYTSSSTPNPAIVNALTFDRGNAVFDVPLNTRPSNVDLTTWQQQRLVYAASTLIGTHYQHLHLPQFDPANTSTTFPWSPVSTNSVLQTTQDLEHGASGTAPNPYKETYGSPQPGIDCTDFAAYTYNLALGIQMHSGTANQITFSSGSGPALNNHPMATVLSATGDIINPNFLLSPNYGTNALNGPTALDSLEAQLQAGDLLYIRGGSDISHVVIWLGQYGTNADGTPSNIPLVISSHDNTPAIFDTTEIDPVTGLPLDGQIDAHLPPPGVEILPFTPDTWFYQNFSVAMQVNVVPEPSSGWLLALGLPLLFFAGQMRRRFLR